MNPWRELKRLPREQWILALSILVNRLGTMALPFLVLYLTKDLGFSVETAAVVLGLFGFASLAVAPLGGWLTDRWGAYRICLASLFLTTVVMACFPLARSLPAVVTLTVLWSLVSEVFRPASMALAADHAPPELRKAAFALMRLAVNLGMAVGPAVGGFVAEASFRSLFWIDAATTLLGGLVMIAFFRAPAAPLKTEGSPAHPWASLRESLVDRRMRYFVLALVPVAVVFFQHASTMPLYMTRDLGLRESAYGALFAINTALIILLEIPLNLWTSHWSHGRALALGAALFAVGFGAMAVATNVPALVLTVVVWTFGEMILFPQCAAYVTEIAPAAKRGSYLGTYSMGFSFAFVFGPSLGAWIYDEYGAATLWVSMLALGLVSTGLFARMERK